VALKLRLIPRLDIKGNNVIKGVRLEGLRVVGKPDDMVRRYEAWADEFLFIDAVASLYGRNAILGVIERASADAFVPFTVGGGIRSLDDIRAALLAGADRVAINTAAIKRPAFITEAAQKYGSQAVVVNIEAKRRGRSWEAFTENGRQPTGRDAVEWASEAVAMGAGEILLTSVDREGTRSGFDLDLIRAVRVPVPVIACGGAGTAEHVAMCPQAGASAIACASIFHYGLVTDLKGRMAAAGHPVRPCLH
jgi:cyclase